MNKLAKNKIRVTMDTGYTEQNSLRQGEIIDVGPNVSEAWKNKNIVFPGNVAHFVSNDYGWVLDFNDVLFEVH